MYLYPGEILKSSQVTAIPDSRCRPCRGLTTTTTTTAFRELRQVFAVHWLLTLMPRGEPPLLHHLGCSILSCVPLAGCLIILSSTRSISADDNRRGSRLRIFFFLS